MKVTVYQGENFILTNEHVLRQAASQLDLTPLWVLVPDRFTLQAERQLLTQRGHLLNARVLTFSMLYRQVAAELNHGEPLTPVLDKTSAVLYLWAAIKQVQNQLTWFKNSVEHYDFAEKMFNTLNQMRSSGVDFTTLETQVKATVSQQKYHDINLIYQAYQAQISGKTDSAGMLEYLLEHLTDSQVVRQTKIFVCGFESLSPARLQVVEALCKLAPSVTIAASQPELSQQLSKYPHYQIDAPAFVPERHTACVLTERGEAHVVAEKIVHYLNQGVSPDHIVVLLTEFETVAPVWQVVFDEYKIPVNLDLGKKLSTMPEAKYLRDLLEMSGNDNTENTLAVLANQCSGVPDETMWEQENQILPHHLRASSLPDLPKLTATKDVSALCEQLKNLTTHPKLQEILEKISQFPALSTLTPREFISLFWALCSATKISGIPQYVDRVLIAPVNDWVPSQMQYLFIANCTPDNFPQGQADDDILQELDLVGTGITPTPRQQRERNVTHAHLLTTVATKGIYFSGTNPEFQPIAYQPQSTFVLPTEQDEEQASISVGRELFFPAGHVPTTMLEQYYSCPYLNFLENGLRLHPRDIVGVNASQIGIAIHEALKIYFTKHDLASALEKALQMVRFEPEPLVANLAKEIRFIIHQLETAFQGGQFQIAGVEQPVTLPLEQGLTLVGRVDRVDCAPLGQDGSAILVLDYKTGRAPTSIAKNIYLGSKLQLPLYASILCGSNAIAGAGYLPFASGYAEDRKDLTLRGFIAKDYFDRFPPQLLNPRARHYLSTETIDDICIHAENLVEQAVAKLTAGDVAAVAVSSNVCQFCPVVALCPRAGGPYRGAEQNITWNSFHIKGGEA